MKISGKYLIKVDHERSLNDGIEAGKYDDINDDINRWHFSKEQSGVLETEVVLIDLSDKNKNKHIDRSEVLEEMEKHGLRPATLSELLALGENFPELQRECEIIALGSVWKEKNAWNKWYTWHYPCLDAESPIKRKERELGLDAFTFGHGKYIRFAAVKKL